MTVATFRPLEPRDTWLAVHADHRGCGLGTLLALTVSAIDGPDEIEGVGS